MTKSSFKKTTTSLPLRFFPVIHTGIFYQDLKDDVEICVDAKVDGFFFNNYGSSLEWMMDLISHSRGEYSKVYSDYLVGINCLGVSNLFASKLFGAGISSLWCDDSGVIEDPIGKGKPQNLIASIIVRNIKDINSKSEYFGSIAFKGQPQPKNLKAVVESACKVCDVVVTSGSATGSAPDVAKIELIRSYMPKGKRLAIASGVDLENVEAFVNAGATDFLVNSSISSTSILTGSNKLSPSKVMSMAKKIKELNLFIVNRPKAEGGLTS